MARCDVCGNDYDKAFTVSTPGGGTGTFDSFECAIHALAPRCEHCACVIVGHGVEADGRMYCCASCARQEGEQGLRDRVDGPGEALGAGRDAPPAAPAGT